MAEILPSVVLRWRGFASALVLVIVAGLDVQARAEAADSIRDDAAYAAFIESQAGNFVDAEQRLKALIKSTPANAGAGLLDSMNELGSVLMRQGKLGEAQSVLEQARRKEGNQPLELITQKTHTLALLAKVYRQKGNADAGIACQAQKANMSRTILGANNRIVVDDARTWEDLVVAQKPYHMNNVVELGRFLFTCVQETAADAGRSFFVQYCQRLIEITSVQAQCLYEPKAKLTDAERQKYRDMIMSTLTDLAATLSKSNVTRTELQGMVKSMLGICSEIREPSCQVVVQKEIEKLIAQRDLFKNNAELRRQFCFRRGCALMLILHPQEGADYYRQQLAIEKDASITGDWMTCGAREQLARYLFKQKQYAEAGKLLAEALPLRASILNANYDVAAIRAELEPLLIEDRQLLAKCKAMGK